MRALITGGEGFIGTHLMKALPNATSYDIIDGFDATNLQQLESIITQGLYTHIIHLSAISDVNSCQNDPKNAYIQNVIATDNVVKMCTKYNLKLIFASSAAVYGATDIIPTPESAPLLPDNVYGFTKLQSENIIKKSLLQYSILRFSNVYGEGNDKGIIHKLKNNDHVVLNNLEHTRDYIHVDDVVSAIIKACQLDGGYTLNISTGRETSILELIIESLNTYSIVESPEVPRSCLDNKRAKNMLKWEPENNVLDFFPYV